MTDFGVPVLANLLSEADLAAVVALAERRKYAHGDQIHERGDPRVAMGLVVRGHVKLVSPRNNGREYFVSLIGPGQNYGDIALVRRNGRAHRALAMGETEVDHLSGEAFARLCERPGFVAALYRVAAFRLSVVIDFVDDMRALKPELRLAKLLLQISRSGTGGRAIFTLPQEELSGFLGVSTVTLAKGLRHLRALGLIDTGYRRLALRDEGALESWVRAADPD